MLATSLTTSRCTRTAAPAVRPASRKLGLNVAAVAKLSLRANRAVKQVTKKTGKLTSEAVPFVSALAALEPKDGDEMAINDMVVSVSADKPRRALKMPVFESQDFDGEQCPADLGMIC